MRQLIYTICCFLLLLPGVASSQVAVVFVPEVQGRTLDGLLQVRVNNTGTERKTVVLNITVTAGNAGKIVTVKTPAFDLMPGLNSLPAGLMRGAVISFGTNKIADVVRQSHLFTAAEYEYCFEVTEGSSHLNGTLLGQQCFNYALQPFSPLVLTSPYNTDQICDKRPAFFWQPLLPAIPGMQYRLILTELKPGQNKAEAIRYNVPVLNQSFINTPMMFYPPSLPELKEEGEYLWQVTAYKGDVLLATSELWSFAIHCQDSSKPIPGESFRNIEDLTKGNFYIASGYIRFAMKNAYGPKFLQYTIGSLSDPNEKIKHLPKVKILHGDNHVIIDISENSSFKDGNYYELMVTMPDNTKQSLRFLYTKPIE